MRGKRHFNVYLNLCPRPSRIGLTSEKVREINGTEKNNLEFLSLKSKIFQFQISGKINAVFREGFCGKTFFYNKTFTVIFIRYKGKPVCKFSR